MNKIHSVKVQTFGVVDIKVLSDDAWTVSFSPATFVSLLWFPNAGRRERHHDR